MTIPSDEQLNLAMCELAGEVQMYAVKKGDLYYRPNSCGYTQSLSDCGRYTYEQGSLEIVTGERMSLVPLPLPNYLSPDSPRRLIDEAEARLTEKEILCFEQNLNIASKNYREYISAPPRQRVIAILQVKKPEMFK